MLDLKSAKYFIYFLLVITSLTLVYATVITRVPTTQSPVQYSYSGYVTEGTFTIVTRTALTSTCYEQVNSSNNVLCLENEGTNARDAYFVTNFTMPTGTINSVFVTGEGQSTSATPGTCTLALYNNTASAWQTVNSFAVCVIADTTLTYNISTTPQKTAFIGGDNVVRAMFVLLSTAVTDDLNLDYISAKVDYTPPTDTCTYTSGNWNINLSDNCIITTNVNLGARKNNLTTYDFGNLTVKANVTGWKVLHIGARNGKMSFVRCTRYGCFK
jgi:hypothetical protein